MIVDLLEEMCLLRVLVVHLQELTRQPQLPLVRTIGIIKSLEALSLIDVREQVTIIVSAKSHIPLSESDGLRRSLISHIFNKCQETGVLGFWGDRKSTRLNSSH